MKIRQKFNFVQLTFLIKSLLSVGFRNGNESDFFGKLIQQDIRCTQVWFGQVMQKKSQNKKCRYLEQKHSLCSTPSQEFRVA
jgi:hypothetical protein